MATSANSAAVATTLPTIHEKYSRQGMYRLR